MLCLPISALPDALNSLQLLYNQLVPEQITTKSTASLTWTEKSQTSVKRYVPFRRAKHFFCPYLPSEEKPEFCFFYTGTALARWRTHSKCFSTGLTPAAAADGHREKVRPDQIYTASLEKSENWAKKPNLLTHGAFPTKPALLTEQHAAFQWSQAQTGTINAETRK